MTIQHNFDQLKSKYWKPEWDSMSEQEKFNDPQYTTYLYNMFKLNLESYQEQLKETTNPEVKKLLKDWIKQHEAILEHFNQIRIEENDR